MTSTPTAGRDIFYGYWVLAGLVVVAWFGFATYLVSLGPAVIDVQREFGWSRTETVAAYSLGVAAQGFGSPVFGWLTDRLGARNVLYVGAVGMSASCWLIGSSNGLTMWYVGWIAVVVFQIFVSYVPCNKILTYWFLRNRGLAFGLMAGAGGLSYMAAAIWGWLIETWGWRPAWFIVGVIFILVAVPVTWLVVRERPEEKGWLQDGLRPGEMPAVRPTAATPRHRPPSPIEADFSLQQAMATRALWLVCIASCFISMALNIITTQLIPFLEAMTVPKTLAGAILGTQGLISIVGRVGSGLVADRFGTGIIRWVYAGGVFAQALAIVIISLVSGTEMLGLVYAYVVIYGLGQGIGVTMPTLLFANYYGPAAYGAILGVWYFAMRFGSTGGPLFAAFVFDVTGAYTIAFYVTAAVLFVAVILLLFATAPRPRSAAAAIR